LAKDADNTAQVTFTAADVQALVSAQVSEAIAGLAALMNVNSPPASDWSRQLALSLAEFTDRGNNRKRVAPEEMARREDARVRLFERLNELHDRGVELEYWVRRKTLLDEQLIEPKWLHPTSKRHMDTTICWPGVPNEAMEPINDAASEVYELFVTSVGGVQPRKERQRVTPRGLVIVEGHTPTTREAPQVGNGSGGAKVKITGRDQPGEVVQTRILGTIAPAARQINGRAAG
jgi:hypothetical protein